MTFTYNLDTPDNVTRVRWHLSDTAQPEMVSDEEINFAISEFGTYQKAVIAIINKKLAEFANEPDFKADWLTVNSSAAVAGLEKLRGQKLKEFGLLGDSTFGVSMTARVTHNYRADSGQTAAPDYSDGV